MIVGELGPGSLQRRFIVKGNAESAFSPLSVIVDSDIFDIDAFCGQDDGQSGDSAGLVNNIYGEGVIRLQRALSPITYGVALGPGFLQKPVDGILLFAADLLKNLGEGCNVPL